VLAIRDVKVNIEGTSDKANVANIIPDPDELYPAFWTPAQWDIIPLLKVDLPEVYGLLPEEYDVMTIVIKARNFFNMTVTVVNSDKESVLKVSRPMFCCRMERHKTLSWKQYLISPTIRQMCKFRYAKCTKF